jgi:hypothetical protein
MIKINQFRFGAPQPRWAALAKNPVFLLTTAAAAGLVVSAWWLLDRSVYRSKDRQAGGESAR